MDSIHRHLFSEIATMLGIKTNCELLSAYLGLFSGLLAGTLLLTDVPDSIQLTDLGAIWLLMTGFSLTFLEVLFVAIFHQSFEDTIVPAILPGLLISGIVLAIMLIIPTP